MKPQHFALMAAALLPATVSAQAPAPAAPFVLKQLAPGVYAAIDGPEHRAGSNAGFVIGDDGVLVVDAFFTEEAAKALVNALAAGDAAPMIKHHGMEPPTKAP